MASEKNILVVGGAGYIGSHLVKQLLNLGRKVIVLDDLSNGHAKAVDSRAKLVVGDAKNLGLLHKLFKKHNISAVIDLADKSIVPESIANPVSYIQESVNIVSSLLRVMKLFKVRNFIYSSSALVYGSKFETPFTEESQTNPETPLAFSKLASESIIKFASQQYNINYCIFRHYNVAGSYETSEIGEAHINETHLIPNIIINGLNHTQITIFGNDYLTKDKTNVRDYIHVMDIVDAYIKGIEYLENEGESVVLNLGSNIGYSNLEVLHTAEKILRDKINYVFGARRIGDAEILLLNNSKAKELLNWEPKRDLEKIIETDATWRRTHPKLYEDQDDHKLTPTQLEQIIKLKSTKKITKMLEEVELKDREHLKEIYKQNKSFLGNKILSK